MATQRMVVMGVFDDALQAERAVARMTALGVPRDEISFMAHPAAIRGEQRQDFERSITKSGAVAGGATLAATLVGIALFAVPLGAVLVAGPLALFGGAAAAWGAPYFSPDSLSELGVRRADAKLAIEAVRRGGVVVAARIDDRLVRPVADAMDRAGAIDLRGRAAEWEREGWDYEPNAPIWTVAEIERERALRHPVQAIPGRVSEPPVTSNRTSWA